MDLRSGRPFWYLKNGLLHSYPRLTHDAVCDVAVLGGGITGALVAHELALQGVKVVMLDRRDVATGSTAASTALLQHEIDVELADLIERVGEEHAVRAYKSGLRAVERVGELVDQLHEDCGYSRRESIYLASKEGHVARLRRECEVRKTHGFDVDFLEPVALKARFNIDAPGAIRSGGDAVIDPFRFTHALIAAACAKGLKAYDRTDITKVETGGGKATLTTADGKTVTAKRVVFATGYESGRYLKQDVGNLTSTFAAVTEPIANLPDWLEANLVWESARPYFYVRTTPEGRILFGGEDAPYATDHKRDKLLEAKVAILAKRLRKLLPGVDFAVDYSWAGTFGETKDGLAYIGPTKEWEDADFALGYGGNGITMSVVAARLIVDRWLGIENPDAVVFRFDR